MVVPRGATYANPGLQEVIFVSGVSHPIRSHTRKICELPPMLYGNSSSTLNKCKMRLDNTNRNDTLWKKSNITFDHKENGYTIRPPRRVRFTLPSQDGMNSTVVGAGSVGVKSTAGDVGWLPPRSNFSQRSDVRRSKSHPINLINNNYNKLFKVIVNRNEVEVPVTASPGPRNRIHPTGKYIRGTLSPTASAAPHAAASPEGLALLRAARDGDDGLLADLLRRAAIVGISEPDLNAVDTSGRTVLSYIASNGTLELMELILQLPCLDPNKPDNEGNTPLHFAAQAGQVECLNCILSRCRGIEIDARNNLGFTPLMKAALQGRNKCAKLLLFAGANPTLRDNGRGFRADQWARFCGRYICADVIEKHARQRLLERSTSYGNWGIEHEVGARVLMGKVVPVPPAPPQSSNGLKSKLRKVFRSSSGVGHNDTYSSARLVTQLTSAALCASSPVLPSAPTVPPVVKSLIRPLTVPRLQITLVNNNGDHPNNNLPMNGSSKPASVIKTVNDETSTTSVMKFIRDKKKK